jgi:hypothetical protein
MDTSRTKAESVTYVSGTFRHLCLGPLNEAGHFTQLSLVHEANSVRYASVTATDDQLVAVELYFIDQ